MPNCLKMPKKSQVLALLALGWSYRRIEAETGVRRETVSRYDEARQSNAAKAFPGSDPSPPADFPDHSFPKQHLVEEFSTHCSNQTFDERVRPRHMRHRLDFVDLQNPQIRRP